MEKKGQGFTLIELLTALAIIGVLAAILIPTVSGVLQRGEQSAGQSTMRHISSSIRLYAIDKGGQLPGSLWPGQVAELDPARSGRLVRELAPYMDFPVPETGTRVIEAFAPPAFWAAVEPGKEAATRVYVLQDTIMIDGVEHYPFGAQAAALPDKLAADNPKGLPSMQLFKALHLFDEQWLLSDVDARHPAAEGKYWGQFTVPEPFHGSSRNTLYWDGRVEMVPAE